VRAQASRFQPSGGHNARRRFRTSGRSVHHPPGLPSPVAMRLARATRPAPSFSLRSTRSREANTRKQSNKLKSTDHRQSLEGDCLSFYGCFGMERVIMQNLPRRNLPPKLTTTTYLPRNENLNQADRKCRLNTGCAEQMHGHRRTRKRSRLRCPHTGG
jgi:hypothetical protein